MSNISTQDRIHLYFNRLTLGCGNSACDNVNCLSSLYFQHKGISNNQAAVIAINLVRTNGLICGNTTPSTVQSLETPLSSSNHDNIFRHIDINEQESGHLPSDFDSPNLSTLQIPEESAQAGVSDIISNSMQIDQVPQFTGIFDNLDTPQHDDDLLFGSLHGSNLPSEGLSRLLLRLSNTTRSAENSIDNIDLIATFNLHENIARTFNSANRNDDDVATGACSSEDSSLKALLHQSLKNESYYLASADATLPSIYDSEQRSTGLTFNELNRCISACKKDNNWTNLRALIENTFNCFAFLATSFQSTSTYENVENHTIKSNTVESSLSQTLIETPTPSNIDIDMIDLGEVVSNLSEVPQPTDCIPSLKQDTDIEMYGDPTTSCMQSLMHTYMPPKKPVAVDIFETQRAYQAILSLPEESNVVQILLRSIPKFIISELRYLLVVSPPSGLRVAKPDPHSVHDDLQQSITNVFVILYACPLVTDPLYFEHLLPILCRATTWLPMPLQARLCRTWADNAKLPPMVADAAITVEPDLRTSISQTAFEVSNVLVDLQKILLQHVTLRCLMIEPDSSLNDESQIREAANVLRVVYYASLLAGRLDPLELRELEKKENADFDSELPLNFRRFHKRRAREDPLSAILGISPNDCRVPLIPAKDFINEILNEAIEVEKDLICYRTREDPNQLSFMELPFLLQTATKGLHLYYENRLRMIEERRTSLLQSLLTNDLEMPFFKLNVSRERIVEDALVSLELAWLENPRDLKKQLYVEFDGEQGIDEGGLSKEFFQLIIERIFNPDFGMFILDEETRTFWFNPSPMEDLEREYCLVGAILGLAIYNHVILDIRFPSVLYRKLVGKFGGFDDLKTARPGLAKGLQFMLDYENDDFSDIFCASFVITYKDMFGCPVTQELIPSGDLKPVTKENRQEYVDLYADFILNKSMKRQFSAFRRGFQMVVDETPLTFLFSPDEIELLVRGSQEYKFSELERVTEYEGDYTPETPIVRHFWSVVHNLPPELQLQLLEFTTGSDRIPLGGMSKLKFVIARQGPDTDRLPTAHTCFNILLLPEYSSREKLERCLLIAISFSKGFGMF